MSLINNWIRIFIPQSFNETELLSMRTRELRNYLIQRSKLDVSVVKGIIDKAELRSLALFYARKEFEDANGNTTYLIIIVIVGFLFVSSQYGKHILSFFKIFLISIIKFLTSDLRISQKSSYIWYNLKSFQFIEALMITASIVIDFVVVYTNVTIFLSWIVAKNSPIRQYFLPTLSIPLSLDTLSRQGPRNSGNTIQLRLPHVLS